MSLRRCLARGQLRRAHSNRCETRKCSRYTNAELIWIKFSAFKRENGTLPTVENKIRTWSLIVLFLRIENLSKLEESKKELKHKVYKSVTPYQSQVSHFGKYISLIFDKRACTFSEIDAIFTSILRNPYSKYFKAVYVVSILTVFLPLTGLRYRLFLFSYGVVSSPPPEVFDFAK